MAETNYRFTTVSRKHSVERSAFVWYRNPKPRQWVDAVSRELEQGLRFSFWRERRWLLVDGIQTDEVYEPLTENPELFRTFCSLPETEGAFADFARRYGFLGSHELVLWHSGGVVPECRDAESFFGCWVFNLRLMKALLTAYDSVRRSRWNDLAKWLEISPVPGDSRRLRVQPRPDSPLSMGVVGLLNSMALQFNVVRAPEAPTQGQRTRATVLQWVTNGISLQLSGSAAVHAELRTVTAQYDYALRFVPDSLLGAMWLQFAETVEGSLDHRQCRSCRNWMLVSAGKGRRAHAHFCSANCRLRYWRKSTNIGRRAKR